MRTADLELEHLRPRPRPLPPIGDASTWLDGSPAVVLRLPVVPLWERALALALLLLASPLLLLQAAIVLASDGRPALYSGRRLGLLRMPFTMYKVRTLRRDAALCTSGRLLNGRDGLEIPGGRLLRDSRLDEIPQLWNVVRGQMRFIGPRPERAEVYREQCRSIPGYDRRFEVLPGIVGPSQLFTPHATPKLVRARLDNASARRARTPRAFVGLLVYALLSVAFRLVSRAERCALEDLLRCRLLRRQGTRRRIPRTRLRAARARIVPMASQGGAELLARAVDINEEALCVRCAPRLALGTAAHMRLEVELVSRGGARRIRSADCEAIVVGVREDALVLEYSAVTPRSQYVVHQYFLGESLAPPTLRLLGRWRPALVPRPRAARAATGRSGGGQSSGSATDGAPGDDSPASASRAVPAREIRR